MSRKLIESSVGRLSGSQRIVLEYLLQSSRRSGKTPTLQEIVRRFNLEHQASGSNYLTALESAGYITKTPADDQRNSIIELTEKAYQLRKPLWFFRGEIAAGNVNENADYREFLVDDVADICPEAREGDYFLRITGDSMVDAGIQPGQLALMRPGVPPKQGAICAIWVEGEGGTLKHLYVEGEIARLVPANSNYSEMEYPVESINVQGVLIATINVTSFK
ncbi:MAG: winged helix DNA-binding protein [Ignavibacteriae bacterium]|nr:winged helix DNA-binding protein [Ignavibacteriota bacterium]MCB9215885.1 winged helix DNA-binding protein [Ignavibacteria bacterium]